MPQYETTRGNAGRSTPSARRRARRQAPAPYVAPPQRSDAAQRAGARPAPRRYSPNPVARTPMPSGTRSDAAQRRGAKPVVRRGVQKRLAANKRAAKQKRLVARHKLFPTDPFKHAQKQQRNVIGALTALRAQDPEKYERNQRSFASNAVRDAAGTADKAWKGAADLAKDAIDRRERDQKVAGIGGGGGEAVSKVTKEALDLVANAPTGAYQAAAATHEAVNAASRKAIGKSIVPGGHGTARGEKLWKDYKDTSAIPAAVSGNWSEAAKRAKNAPVATALELSAGKAIVGRGVGAGGRATGAKWARTDRPNLKLYTKNEGKGPEVERKYSKDAINKLVQVAAERRTAKGSRVRRRGPNAGTQRRPGRDPHIDRDARLVPSRRLSPEGPRPAPQRRKLKRRVDTRVFAQARALEHRITNAVKAARKGKNRERLEEAWRAESVRERMRSDASTATGKERKELRELIALPDKRLLDFVAASRQTVHRDPEAEAVAAKVIERRARRGQDLGPETRKALDDAMRRRIEADVAQRKSTGEAPGAATLRAVIAAAPGSKFRYAGPERRAAPRHDPLRPDEMEGYFANRAAPPRDPVPGFEPVTPTKADLPQVAARLEAQRAARENQLLLAREFGIGGTVASKSLALRRAASQRKLPESLRTDLVPFRVDDKHWTLVPRQVADRFDAHKKVEESAIGPGSPLDRATSVFKDVVLTSSSPSKWLGGNIADIGMRTILEGITPLDITRGIQGNKVLRREGLQGEQASAANTGGGLYTAGEAIGRPVGKPAIPGLGHMWRGWKRTIYTIEHGIETLPQFGRMGKTFRQEGATRWAKEDAGMKSRLKTLLKLNDDQINSYFKGVASNRALEARLQKQVEDVIGRWGKVSPGMRTALSIAPFAQWLGAATRYVLVTLPIHHPIKTGVMASIMQMTLEERKRLGLSYLAPEEKQAPDYQMGMLPLKVGKNKYGPVVEGVRTSRMTSLGTAAEVPWGIPEFVFPQFSGAFNAFKGQSFTGEPLEYPEHYPKDMRGLPISKADRLPIGIGAQLETMVPFASAFRRAILEQGRPAEPTSTLLTPATRRKFNYDTKQYEEVPAPGIGAGALEWAGPVVAPPFAPLPRIYTKGAGRDIERSQQTTKQNEEWSKRRAKKKDRAAAENPFLEPSIAQREKNPFEKQRAKPKDTNPFR